MPAQPLSPEQRSDAARLKAVYTAKKRELSLTQEGLAAACGWESQGTVSQYFNGKIPLNIDAAVKFARVLKVSVSEFSPQLASDLAKLHDPGAPIERDPSHMASQNADDLSPSLNSQKLEGSTQSPKTSGGSSVQSAQVVVLASQDHFVIPQYGAGGSMGHGLLLPEQPGVIERWTVSHEWLDKNARGYTAARNLCIVTGFGPSMRPMFNPGDPLLVDRGITSVPADGIYFFRIGDEGFIKQLQKIPTAKGVVYRAKSANPDYDPFEITADMDFEVLGKVIRVWCGTDF